MYPIAPLGKIAKFLNGGTPSRGVAQFYVGHIPWITSADLKEGNDFVTEARFHITEEAIQSSATRIVPKGNILFVSRTGVGKVAITGLDVCISQDFTGIIPDTKQVNIQYLFQFLRANQSYFTAHQRGATIQGVTRRVIEELRVPLPSLPEQQRIAAILDAANALRARRRAALGKLDALLGAVFFEMFGEAGGNPKGWPIATLGSLFARDREGTKCGPFGSALKREEYTESGIPVWTMDNIQRMHFDPRRALYINAQKYEQMSGYRTIKGDIIISRAGTVGKMCVVETNAPKSIISTNLIRLSLDEQVLDPYYFVSLMTFGKGRVGRLETGTDGAYTFMNTGILKKLEVPVPPIQNQLAYRRFWHEQEVQIAKMKQSQQVTEDLFVSLQQRAFRGEL